MRRLALLAALVALLPTSLRAQEIGSGELWIHERVMKYYRKFQADPSASFFAVSTNGLAAGYSYCPSIGDCFPLDGKREAIQACRSVDTDLPGNCYIFANENRILWRGEVHVLTHEEFMARHYGPETIEEALDQYVLVVQGPIESSPQDFKASAAVWQRNDFHFPPADFVLVGDECRYAFKNNYLKSGARNFFLADKTGRFCAYSTGFAQESAAEAFRATAAACASRAPFKVPCLVFAVDEMLLAGRTKL